MRLFVIFILCIMTSAQYARLTEEHWSMHFAEESSNTADSVSISGTDGRFNSITPSIDYAMMSWV